MEMGQHELAMASVRLKSLGDGVFSVAMTILVIELKLPSVKGNSWHNLLHAFIFLGALFYMVVCFVPFTTRFLAANTLRWYAILMYGLNLSMCNLTLYAQWVYGIKRPSLHAGILPKEVKEEGQKLFLIPPILYSVAIAVSFFIPGISIVIYCLTLSSTWYQINSIVIFHKYL